MNLKILKEKIDSYLEESDEYILMDKKVMEGQESEEITNFNIEFTDKERSVIYRAVGKKEAGKVLIEVNVVLFTGIEEDIDKEELFHEYKIIIKNNGKGKEAIVTLKRFIENEADVDFQEAIDTVLAYGVNKLVYKFIRTYPPTK